MHILSLRTENYKRVQLVEIRPNGNIVEIKGKNASGKSSTLDSVLAALAGKDAIPSKPIHRGQQKGSVRIELGADKPALIVTRTLASKEDGEYTTQLTVEAPDGARYSSPQAVLDDLVGSLTFDPNEFAGMKSREQLDLLRRFVADVDFDAIDAATRGDFERRTEVNRDEKALRARLAALTVPGDPRQKRIDESALVAELEAAGKAATEIEKERARRVDLLRVVRSIAQEGEQYARLAQESLDRIATLQAEIASLEAHARSCAQKSTDAAAQATKLQADAEALSPLALPPDTASIKARMDAARKNNADIATRERVMKERADLERQVAESKAAADKLTESIESRKATVAAAVATAKLPIEGLSFGDGEVLLNGFPLNQASQAERIRVSVAIGAALNPKLRVMFVREASLIDEDSMKLLAELAEQHDMQVWCEMVLRPGDKAGVILENGRVKARETEAAA